MLIIFYCFRSHVYYFQLEIYSKTIIEFSLWLSPLEMYSRTIIGFGFCDMQNYQCLGKSYQPRLTSTLIILHITTTSSNNCLLLAAYKIILGICTYDITSKNNSWYSVIMMSCLRIMC